MANSGEKFVEVGKVADAHGIKGEIYVRLYAGQADWLADVHELRLMKDNRLLAYPITNQRPHKEGLILRLQGLDDRTSAEKLRGAICTIPEDILVAEAGETPFLHELLGFELHDRQLGLIGCVVGFDFNGAQDLLIVQSASGKTQVPFVKAFVEQIAYNERKIMTALPEGLVAECAFK